MSNEHKIIKNDIFVQLSYAICVSEKRTANITSNNKMELQVLI